MLVISIFSYSLNVFYTFNKQKASFVAYSFSVNAINLNESKFLLFGTEFRELSLFRMAGFIETDICFPKARISSWGKRIHFTKTGTALGATDICLPKPRIVLGETDMFLEVSMGHEIDMGHTQIAVSQSQLHSLETPNSNPVFRAVPLSLQSSNRRICDLCLQESIPSVSITASVYNNIIRNCVQYDKPR